MKEFEGKTAVITGAASGIGKAMAERFAQEKMQVVLADIEEEALEKTVENLRQYQYRVIGVKTDVLVEESINELFSKATAEYGNIHILCNNAGIGANSGNKAIWEIDRQDWDWVMGVNLKGTYLMSYYASNEMKKKGGSIVNLASINGLVGYNKGISSKLKGINPYPHSKGGVIQLTKDMAVGFAELNIRVNALCPGYSKTNLTKMLWEDKKIEEYITSLHPMGRLAEPEEIAYAALFLASDEASFITGACLPVDGGYLAQ